jgi:histone-lysine N-methyltransferase SETMAR
MKHFFNTTMPGLTQVQQQEMQFNFPVLPHTPYTPDLTPSDFHLFPKLKEHLKGQCFSFHEAVKSAVRKWFQKQNTNFLKDGFQKLVQRWCKCIEVRGDFVEK